MTRGRYFLETDTTENHDLSGAHLVGSYTADADRLILIQIFLDTVAGNGNYVFYAKLQIAGAGSDYVVIPKTTAAAASGETAIAAQSGIIAVSNTDILTCYVDCLAGDTSVDCYVRFYEVAALQPTTADASLDVSATGEAGLDFNNIKVAAGATTLTNITIPTITNLTNLPAVPADWLTAAGVKADAIAEIQSGLSTLSAAQVNAEVVDALTVDVLADSVAADGSRPTIGQALIEISRFLMERSITGTTMTVHKEDGTAVAMTFTLDDATNPTSYSRAS